MVIFKWSQKQFGTSYYPRNLYFGITFDQKSKSGTQFTLKHIKSFDIGNSTSRIWKFATFDKHCLAKKEA